MGLNPVEFLVNCMISCDMWILAYSIFFSSQLSSTCLGGFNKGGSNIDIRGAIVLQHAVSIRGIGDLIEDVLPGNGAVSHILCTGFDIALSKERNIG